MGANSINGFLMSTWENEILLKPFMLFYKSFADAIFAYWLFKGDDFTASIIALTFTYIIGKGATSQIVSMLQTVVD